MSKRTQAQEGAVYVITDGEFTKVGRTTATIQTVDGRLKAFQTGNPRLLKIAAVFLTTHAPLVEHNTHCALWKYRSHGGGKEWFKIDALTAIDAVLAATEADWGITSLDATYQQANGGRGKLQWEYEFPAL